MKYSFKEIEKKWQKVWAKENHQIWHAEDFDKKPKIYDLGMFPYPSGEGLHLGHVENYTATDIVARYLRMKGFNVLHPIGWDAFGLPAENYAIKTKTHPRLVVEKNVKEFKKQLSALGFSYDWQREINTTDPDYYKWTQWIFLKLFENGLAYEAEIPVNWCPSCKTVLANEEVINGTCERCGSTVEQKNLKQWLLKITAYADKLLKDLDGLDWPQNVKEMQKNWIGRSEGATIKFEIRNSKFEIKVFTTRADTLFGATYVVLAPEHPIIKNLKPDIKNWPEVEKYIEEAKHKLERERISEEIKTKTGVELKGIKVINPTNNEEIPIFVADYVLASYATGAIMAVPAHDQRDFEFATKFNLPIKMVICPNYPEPKCPVLEKAYESDGFLAGSGKFDGTPNQEAKTAIVEWLAKKGLAEKTVNYKLRDWIFSRQRYWGEPIPLVFCESCKKEVEDAKFKNQTAKFSKGELLNPGWIPVTESDLPVELPNVKNYQPTGNAESPLAGIKKWVNTKCPKCGGEGKREINTMPQWAGSCWYYLRYLDPENAGVFVDIEKDKYWAPVDIYIGGLEHAVLHLLYARFWHKFLYDLGIVSKKEPFIKLINQGLVLGPDGQKMSKSRGNVINPGDITKEFGVDGLRLHIMFMGPFEDVKPWDSRGIVGIYRFLNRVFQLISKAPSTKESSVDENEKLKSSEQLMCKTIKKITEDIESYRFNTAISALMILVNEMERNPQSSNINYQSLIKLLFPFAPHLAQELWSRLGNKNLLDYEKWPEYDPKLVQDENFELVIQINGKLRDKVLVSKDIDQKEAEKLVLEREKIRQWVGGKTAKKIIFVPNRLINIII